MINHAIFLDKYHAELDEATQESMMKDYMLNLSSADLHAFIFDNIKAIREYVETADLSDNQRRSIAVDMTKAQTLLQKPFKQAA